MFNHGQRRTNVYFIDANKPNSFIYMTYLSIVQLSVIQEMYMF